MITKKMLEHMEKLHSKNSRIVLYQDWSGHIETSWSAYENVFDFGSLKELKAYLTPKPRKAK